MHVTPFFRSYSASFNDMLVSEGIRTGRKRRRQALCDKHENNSVGNIQHQTSPSFKQISSQKTRKTPMLREDTTKQSSNRPVLFVSHKCFDVFLLFLPSCCVSLIFIITSATPSVLNVKKRISRAHFLFQSAVAWVRHVICAAQF